MRLQLVAVMALMALTQPVLANWVAPDYFTSWQAVPGLLLTVVYTNMSAMVGATYLAAKRTKGLLLTTIYGAVISIGLSLVTVPHLGIIGASLASCLGFAAVLGIRLHETRQFVRINVAWGVVIKYHVVILLQLAIMCMIPVCAIQTICLLLLTVGIVSTDWPFYQGLIATLTNKR